MGMIGDVAGNALNSVNLGVIITIFVIIFAVVILGMLAYGFYLWRQSKIQWTHKLKVRKVINGNQLTEPEIVSMRRFPLIKGAEVFQLEKSVLGKHLFPEPDKYTGLNEYEIVIDDNNRLFIPKGTFFDKDKGAIMISCKHAGIDLGFAQLNDKYAKLNEVSKRIDLKDLIKWGVIVIGMVLIAWAAVNAMSSYVEGKQADVEQKKVEAEMMGTMSEAMESIEYVVNTQQLQLLPGIRELTGEDNLGNLINKKGVSNETS